MLELLYVHLSEDSSPLGEVFLGFQKRRLIGSRSLLHGMEFCAAAREVQSRLLNGYSDAGASVAKAAKSLSRNAGEK